MFIGIEEDRISCSFVSAFHVRVRIKPPIFTPVGTFFGFSPIGQNPSGAKSQSLTPL